MRIPSSWPAWATLQDPVQTPTTRTLKTEKNVYFLLLKKLLFLFLSRQDELFSFKVSNFEKTAVTEYFIVLGHLYFGHMAQHKIFILLLNLF